MVSRATRRRLRAPEAGRRPLQLRKEVFVNRFAAYFIIILSALLGGGSLLLFGAFLITGPFTIIRFDASEAQVLIWDGFLSLLFFIQHSGMMRASFRTWLSSAIPRDYHPATYSIVVRHSSHHCGTPLADIADGPLSDSRSASSAAPCNLFTCNRRFHMGSPGAQNIRRLWPDPHCGPSPRQATPTTRLRPRGALSLGPPSSLFLHACSHLVDSCVTSDRLLFNVLWTFWIVLGSYLEEKDIVAEFGKGIVTTKKLSRCCSRGGDLSAEGSGSHKTCAKLFTWSMKALECILSAMVRKAEDHGIRRKMDNG